MRRSRASQVNIAVVLHTPCVTTVEESSGGHTSLDRGPLVCVQVGLSSSSPLSCAMLQQGMGSYGEKHAGIWDLARDAGWVRDHCSELPGTGAMHIGHGCPDPALSGCHRELLSVPSARSGAGSGGGAGNLSDGLCRPPRFPWALLHQNVALWDRAEEVPGSRTHQEAPRGASTPPPGHN
jgi:hypothetical protein